MAAFVALPLVSLSAQESATLLPSFVWDRLDENAVWRLSDQVPTADLPGPSTPVPLYVQFGFLGCEPCTTLAAVANEELGDQVQRVYVHLDDIMIQAGYTNQQLWSELYEYLQSAPYHTFIPIRRGSSSLMNSVCGAGSNPPSGLLILPSGQVFEVLRSPGVDGGRDAFRRFMAALAS